MNSIEMKQRTQRFTLNLLNFVEGLPRSSTGQILGRQLLRAGTSIAANYRAACRARSRREFTAKLGIVEEEADETGFWLEVVLARSLGSSAEGQTLLKEVNELTAIVVASIRTVRAGSRNRT